MDRATRKKLLDSKTRELLDVMDAEKLSRDLSERGGISEDIRDLIVRQKTAKERSAKLLAVLKTLSAEKYELFCRLLADEGHAALAKQLTKTKEEEEDRPGTNSNCKSTTRANGGHRKTPTGASASAKVYAEALWSCRNRFITDVAADPEGLAARLAAAKGLALSASARRSLERAREAEAKAQLLFDAVRPAVRGRASFAELLRALEGPFPDLSSYLEKELKALAPTKKSAGSAKRIAVEGKDGTDTTAAPPGGEADGPPPPPPPAAAPAGDGSDLVTSLANLQLDLAESQSGTLRQSQQLERCIQATAEANEATRRLEVRLRQAEEQRDAEAGRAEASRRAAEDSRLALDAGLAEVAAERRMLEEQRGKSEAQLRRRMEVLDMQREQFLASMHVELQRQDEKQRQLNVRQLEREDVLESKSLQVVQRGNRQDRRSADHHTRRDRLRERENTVVLGESRLAQREQEAAQREALLKKLEMDQHRKKIELGRLEEHVRMVEATQARAGQELAQRERALAGAEEDVRLIGERLRQREQSLTEREREAEDRSLALREADEELQRSRGEVEKRERRAEETEQEQRAFEGTLESKARELSGAATAATGKEEELARKEEEMIARARQLNSLEGVLDCRLQAQERMERALRMIEVEQIRRDREILDREANQLGVRLADQQRSGSGDADQLLETSLRELEKEDGPGDRKLMSWVEVERQRQTMEEQREQLREARSRGGAGDRPGAGQASGTEGHGKGSKAAKEKEQRDGEQKEAAAAEEEEEEEGARRAEAASVASSFTSLGADSEAETYGYAVELKGARAVKSGTKASFDLRVAGQQSVAAFKNILDTEEGIPAGWQSLLLRGKVLDDGQTLPGDKEATVQLQLKLAPSPVKERDLLKLKVKTSSGKTHSIDFSLQDTVALAKSRIYKYTGIAPHQQRLSYRDVLLENHAPLQLYSIRKNACLDLRLRFRLVSEFSGQCRTELTADEMNTVANLKAMIFEQTDLPLDNLKVSYKGKALDDHRTLSHYSIGEGAVLSVACPVPVKLAGTCGQLVTVNLEPGATTVRELRSLLAKAKVSCETVASGDNDDNDDGDPLDEDQDVLEVVRSGKTIVVRGGAGGGEAAAHQAAAGPGKSAAGAPRGAGKAEKGLDLSVVGSQNVA